MPLRRFLILLFSLILFIGLNSLYAIRKKEKNIIKFGRNLVIEKNRTIRSAAVIVGNITINGNVEDDVVAVGGTVKLGDNAVIGGNVVSVGGLIKRGKSSEIGGNIVEVNIPGISTESEPLPKDKFKRIFWILRGTKYVGLLFLALLIVLIIPNPLLIISYRIEKDTINSILWSIRGLFLIVPLAVILTMSLAGIFLIPLEVILVVGTSLLGLIAVSLLIGRKLIQYTKKPKKSMFLEMTLGITILELVGMIPVIGWIVKAVLTLIGFGGVLASLFSKKPIPD